MMDYGLFNFLTSFFTDAATARNLELILNVRNFGSDHCLYGVMNHTKTAAGGKIDVYIPAGRSLLEKYLPEVSKATEAEG